MNDALKRIEDWHLQAAPCSRCPKDPCDVVKLARALERARATFASCHGYEGMARDAERTLEEVAGEPTHQV